MAPIKVLCVDDNRAMTALVELVIGFEPDLVSVGGLPSAASLLEEVERREADVVLLDLHMPGAEPLAELERLMMFHPAAAVLLFSASEEPAEIEQGLLAGACGFLCKDAEPEELTMAVRRAAGQGKSDISRVSARCRSSKNSARGISSAPRTPSTGVTI